MDDAYYPDNDRSMRQQTKYDTQNPTGPGGIRHQIRGAPNPDAFMNDEYLASSQQIKRPPPGHSRVESMGLDQSQRSLQKPRQFDGQYRKPQGLFLLYYLQSSCL